jgi:DNA-binding transcriptional MerR regulator
MNDQSSHLLTVGQLAQKGHVTIRTLQYYDSSGLLKPSAFSEGGRRLYSRQDSLRLQQILFLKSLGFSLEDIRDQLLPTQSATDLGEIFQKQKVILQEQRHRLEESMKHLDQILKEIREGIHLELDHVFAVVGAMQQNNPYAFMVRHMDPDDLRHYSQKLESDEKFERIDLRMQDMTEELLRLKSLKASPDSDPFQDLARRWWEVVLSITDGDPDKIHKMFEKGADQSIWPEGSKDLRQALETLGQALEIHLKKLGADLPQIQEE